MYESIKVDPSPLSSPLSWCLAWFLVASTLQRLDETRPTMPLAQQRTAPSLAQPIGSQLANYYRKHRKTTSLLTWQCLVVPFFHPSFLVPCPLGLSLPLCSLSSFLCTLSWTLTIVSIKKLGNKYHICDLFSQRHFPCLCRDWSSLWWRSNRVLLRLKRQTEWQQLPPLLPWLLLLIHGTLSIKTLISTPTVHYYIINLIWKELIQDWGSVLNGSFWVYCFSFVHLFSLTTSWFSIVFTALVCNSKAICNTYYLHVLTLGLPLNCWYVGF